MDIKLRLANFPLFWTLKRYVYLARFNLAKRVFQVRFSASEERKNLSLVAQLFRVSFVSFLATLATAWALYKLDDLFPTLPTRIHTLSLDRYTSYLIGVAQIGGVFIGLYYAGMTMVAGAIYAQTPAKLRNLLVRERTGGVYMVYLTFVTFLAVVLCVAAQVLNRPAPSLAVLFLGILAGFGIFAFVKLGRRAFELFDPTSLSGSAFDNLIYWTDQATVKGHNWQDRSFQRHANRMAMDAIEVLETLADYSNRRENLRQQSFIKLTSDILRYLAYYQRVKASIPRQSLWYERTFSHPDWFRSPDSSVQIASRTGTTMRPEEVPVEYWLEQRLEPLVIQCFRANAQTSNLSVLLQLSSLLRLYIAALAKSGHVAHAIEMVDNLAQLLRTEELRKSLSTTELAGFGDFATSLTIEVLLSAAGGARSRSPAQHSERLRTIRWSNRSSIYSAGFSLENVEQLEWLYERIVMEREIEHRRLTPDWYCLDMIFLADLRAIRGSVPRLLDIEALFLKTARELAKESPFASAALLSRSLEYLSKLSYHLRTYQQWHDEIVNKRTLSDLPWPKIDFAMWDKQAEQADIRAHEEIARLIPAIIIAKKDATLPDYRGQFVQVIADDLLRRLVEGKPEIVQKVFPLFWASSFALFDALRPPVPPDAAHLLETELHIASAPIVDVMDLSGYALLLSEYHQKPDLWTTVEQLWRRYLNDSEAIKRLAAIVSLENIRFQIPHRGIIRSEWSITIHRLLSALPHRGPQRYFGIKHVEHPSALVRYAARNDSTDGLEIFIGAFLSAYPESAGLDWGFHRPKEFVEGVQREREVQGHDEDEET